jgi:tRNA(Ser,Leu) C12 N-acetylase TAN1
MARSPYDPGSWNLVVFACEGAAGAVQRRLARAVRVRPTPYRGVLVAEARSDPLAWLCEAWAEDPGLFDDVARITPIQRTSRFERDDVTETLCENLAAAEPLTGSFYVRARLRGLDGRLEARAVERAVGGFLLDRAAALGLVAGVRFDDPDTVVSVEVLGCKVGYGVLDRRIRSLPFVRPR